MTVLCGGGASGARPGVVGNAFQTASGITAYLSTLLPLPLAIAIGALAAVETFEVATYCAVDPPPDPGLTPADMVDFLNPSDLANYLPAQAKVRQWWRHVYWWQVCECTGATTPPLPPPSNPGGQSQNPGLPSGTSVNCYTSNAPYSTVGVASGHTNFDLSTIWLPPTSDKIPVSVAFPLGTVTGQALRLPTNFQSFNFTSKNSGATSSPPSNSVDASILFFDGTGAQKDSQQFLTSQAIQLGPLTGAPRPVGAPTYAAILGQNSADPAVSGKLMTWDVELRFTCPGDGIASPCCPPDPGLELKINQLLDLVINLAGRGSAATPTGWHDGASHTGLRGSGSFLIDARAIGIRLNVTVPPSGVNVDPGNPDFYWDMGFITPYALGSPLRGFRLVFLNQSAAIPDFTDQIGYTLKHGTEITATELLPTTT